MQLFGLLDSLQSAKEQIGTAWNGAAFYGPGGFAHKELSRRRFEDVRTHENNVHAGGALVFF
jgi:hypothetical protein